MTIAKCFHVQNSFTLFFSKVRAELRELAGSMFGFMGVISTICGSLIGLLLVKLM